jgi:cytochrome P450
VNERGAAIATRLRDSRRPPGPPPRGLFGNLKEFSNDRLGSLSRWAAQYGDLVSARFGPRWILFANHPDLVEDVLVHQNRKFIKHYRLRQAKQTLGAGLLTSEGDFWRAQRKLVQPAFHRDKIEEFGRLIVSFTDRLLGTWDAGEVHDLHAEMMRLTLEVVAKALFDADIGAKSADVSEAMETLMRSFVDSTASPLIVPPWLPTPRNLRVARAVGRLDRVLFSIIADRRRSNDDRGDLLSMLLNLRDEETGRRMTDRQLRDECMTLFLAGHETTANTLAWVWYLVARHPAVEEQLHAELERVLRGRLPTTRDLPHLTYTGNIIHEALRLFPPAWMLGREAIEPLDLGGYRVSPGTTAFMTACVIHRDPRWFDNPHAFLPDRWNDGFLQRIPRYAYFPFGGGPRICIGNSFALMESALVLATIAQRHRLKLAPDARVSPLASMTLRPATGVRMLVLRRSGGSPPLVDECRRRETPGGAPVDSDGPGSCPNAG